MDEYKPEILLIDSELDEIIGKPPNWIIRWGITILAIILVLLFFLSYFIKYPETITVPCRILPDNTSIAISVNSSGQIKKLNVTDRSYVHKNDTLFLWKDDSGNYLTAKAPVTGTVEFISALANYTRIFKKNTLFYLQPANSTFSAVFYVDNDKSLKLQQGQNLSISVDNYPPSDYGNLKGKISMIGQHKTEKGYFVKATIFGGPATGKNKTIPMSNVMNGNAEMIIVKKRLFSKLTEKIF